jgi:hypothetical protein
LSDSSGKGAGHGVRLDAEVEAAKKKQHVIKADPAIIKCFDDMFLLLQSGGLVCGVPCTLDLTGDDDAFELDITGGHEMGFTTLENAEEEDDY